MQYLDAESTEIFGINGEMSYPEAKNMWQDAFSCDGGVDFFFSDHPIEAMKARDDV